MHYRSVILLLLFSIQSVYSQTVTLPFFDDFSTTIGPVPDSRLWINGGTVVNNTFAINQPGKNVATFDGRSAKGVPYNFLNQLSYGKTDTLTSKPINMGVYTPADSLYLSFYWQARGLGDLPDDDDTLMVSFLNRKKQWINIWKQVGGIVNDNFKQVLVAVKDTSFLHDAFQFRFETKGRQSGAFDVWHIDYVYLNTNRNAKDIYSKDISVTRFTSNYLKRYRAMPMRQYMVNPAAEVNDTLKAEMFNLTNSGAYTPYAWKVEDIVAKKTYYDAPAAFFDFLNPGETSQRQLIFEPIKDFSTSKAILKFQYSVTTNDNEQPNLPGYDLSLNDSISTYTVLSNYYAYDDGSAEVGADYDQSLGKVAIQFVLSKPDTVGAVMMNFSPYFNNPANASQTFILQILESDKGKPGKTLFQTSDIRVNYSDTLNRFKTYNLGRNVVVKDTFYVSWTKITQEVIAVGVDKNSPQFADKIFYNDGTSWKRNTTLKGSLMVRPVIGAKTVENGENGGDGINTPIEEPFGEPLVVYPNPTSGVLKWNIVGIKTIRISDVAGRVVLSAKVEGQELNIGHLPSNTYFVNFSDGRKNLIHKIVVLH